MNRILDMMQLDIIWANARFEITTLFRGWFFRIFAGLMITIFIFYDIIIFSTATNVPRLFYGLSAATPYANMMMLNLAQVVVIILLATDLFKRDKRTNTTEVFYIRPMTNGAYIIGKTLGILAVFALLNLFVLCIGAVIHFVFGKVNFNGVAYFLNYVLIPFPAFIFIMGLSVFLMRLIKNQAVVALLLLGYFAAVFFYLRDQWHYIFDFVAINLPMFYSDFVGIANLEIIIFQRGLYVLLGLLFILLTILLFTRLPQSLFLKRVLTGWVVIFFLLSVFCGYYYLNFFTKAQELRQGIIDLNQQYFDKKNIKPESYQIDLHHHGNEIEAIVHIKFINPNTEALNHCYFSLNPGLRVTQVMKDNQELKFQQNDHLLLIDINAPLNPARTDSIRIFYSGTIDEAVCYLDINEDKRQEPFSIQMYQIYKKQAFLSNHYVLLPPECIWYPNTALPVGIGHLEQNQVNFIDFSLTVFTNENLTVIAQGEYKMIKPGVSSFKPEQPLPRLSVIIGPYERRSITVDSVDYNLFILPEHNYFDEYFTEIGDTLNSIIREARQDYEVKLNLDYPFNRLSLIEVPVQFFTYPRIWTVAREFIQPEQIWLPENASYLSSADFRLLNSFMDRRIDRSNQTLTKTESETSLLKQFIYNTLIGGSSSSRRFGGPMLEYQPDFNPFPTFFSYTNFFQSDKWQIFNTALEAYLLNRVNNENSDPRRSLFVEGLTESEEVSRQLTKNSLAELMTLDEPIDILPEIIRAKGAYLFKLIQIEQEIEDFDQRISQSIESNRFRVLDAEEFLTGINASERASIQSAFESWYHSKQLPGFLISDIQMFKVVDNNRMRYQVLFKISNPEQITGLVEVQFQHGSFGRRMMSEPSLPEEPARIVKLAGGQSKEIGIVLDSEPRSININALIAWNIPIIFSKQFENAEVNERFSAFDGERIINNPFSGTSLQEIIVDNEDDGFFINDQPFQSYFKRLIHGDNPVQEKSFGRFTWWSPATQWTLIKNASFYGKYIHSAYYIKSGDGKTIINWQANLPADGLYDVYSYMFDKQTFWRRRGRDRENSRSNATFGDFIYTIHHSAGSEQVILDAQNAADGWNFLGTYYFPKGEATIDLSDKSNGQLVVADAIKWIKN